MGLRRASSILWLAGALAAALGCAGDNRRTITQSGLSGPPALLGGETEEEVRRAWGKPDRTVELVDEKTGKSQTLWQYDGFVDTNGSKVTTTVTFTGGKVARVEQRDVPRSPLSTGLPRDSAARRDME